MGRKENAEEVAASQVEDSPFRAEGPRADTLQAEAPVLGVYAQADTASTTVTDAGVSTSADAASTANTAATTAATTSTAGLSAGALGVFGTIGFGVLAASESASTNTDTNTTTNQAPTALALTGALAGSGKNELAENTPTTTRIKVADIAITDDALGSNTLSLSGADKDLFEIVGNALYLKAGTVLDFEAKARYAVTVQVQDSTLSNSAALSQSFELKLSDVDDTAPSFGATASATTTVAENTTTTAVVHTAAATDNVAVTAYAFADGGADNDKFSLNAATGALSFKTTPNFEAPASAAGSNSYSVKIKATDASGNSAVQTVTVNVINANEAPAVRADFAAADAVINLQQGVLLPNDVSAAVDFADPDAHDSLSYSLFGGAVPGLQLLASGQVQGTATQVGSYNITVRATDAGGLYVDNAYQVHVLDTTAPAFANTSATATVAENTATTAVVYTATATDNVAVVSYAFADGGADNDKFSLNATTGALSFKTTPNFEAPASAAGSNSYSVKMQATDAAGNGAVQTVTVHVTDVATPTSAQAFDLWQEAELATLGDSSKNTEALNQYSAEIVQHRDTTSADGSANQTDAAKRLVQYINQVTGTDIVSDAEFDAGFTITGKAAAGAEATIKWRLDKDRTTGADGEGAQVLSLGANDLDNADGDNNHATGTDVTATYNNATGEWSLAFAAGSAALLQATHNTWGSGVHQVLVDTDGNGSRTGTGSNAEASRLFLVASGTAASSDTGLVGQNYSVQDKITSDVFVYYHGDPDGAGIGLWTLLDNGDSASNNGTVSTNRDIDPTGYGDWDYYSSAGNTAGTQATVSNTALHLVTNIAAQTWEFHMGTHTNWETWDVANAQATDHTGFGSNTSRQASLAEAVALYGANFGQDGAGSDGAANSHVVGAVQALSNVGSTNDYSNAEDNVPGGWDSFVWTAAPTPSGHARLVLYYGYVGDDPDADYYYYVTAVL